MRYIFTEHKNIDSKEKSTAFRMSGLLRKYTTTLIGIIVSISCTIMIFDIVMGTSPYITTLRPDVSILTNACAASIGILTLQKNQRNPGLRKERSKWEIINDLLTVLVDEKNVKKTHLMQRACLDWRNFQRYFVFLLDEGFIAKYDNPDNGNFVLTEKGITLWKRLRDVNDLLH